MNQVSSGEYNPKASSLEGKVAPEIIEELYGIRGTIDNIDAALVFMLAERVRATQKVGKLKAKHALPPADPAREKAQIARLQELASKADLDPEFAKKFLNFIIEEVIRHHQAIADEEQ